MGAPAASCRLPTSLLRYRRSSHRLRTVCASGLCCTMARKESGCVLTWKRASLLSELCVWHALLHLGMRTGVPGWFSQVSMIRHSKSKHKKSPACPTHFRGVEFRLSLGELRERAGTLVRYPKFRTWANTGRLNQIFIFRCHFRTQARSGPQVLFKKRNKNIA